MNTPSFSWRIGILLFALTLTILELEIALTRLFSALLQNQMIFMVLSLTIGGLGLGGMSVSAWFLWLKPFSFFKAWEKKISSTSGIEGFIFLFALSLYPMLWGILHTEEPAQASSALVEGYTFQLIFWATLPFFFAGVALSSIFELFSEKVEELYFLDLAGASLGCLSVILLLEGLGGPLPTILLQPVLLFALLSVFPQAERKRSFSYLYRLSFIFSFVLFLSFLFPSSSWSIRFKDLWTLDYQKVSKKTALGKVLQEENAEILATKWDSYARTDLVRYPNNPQFSGEQQLFINTGKRARMLSHQTSISQKKRDLAFLPFAFLQARSGAFHYEVLNLGSGGGYDVRLALFCEAKEVTMVELNPAVIDFLEEEKSYAGDLLRHPRVRTFVDEGRSFLRKTSKRYDCIHSSLTSTLAVEEASQLSFYESYFYTLEAFQEYLSKLQAHGILSILIERPDLRDKLVATFLSLFQKRGLSLSSAMKRIAIFTLSFEESGAYGNLILVKNEDFQAEEIALLEKLPRHPRLQAYLPQSREAWAQLEPFVALSQEKLTLEGPQGWIASYPYPRSPSQMPLNIQPPSDDRPFFFQQEVGWDSRLTDLSQNIFFYLVLFPLMLFFYPVRARKEQDSQSSTPLWHFGLAFLLMGAGFIVLEIALLKQFTLYLSYPTLTLSTTLFGLLCAAGLGAHFTQNLPSAFRLKMACGFILLTVFLQIYVNPWWIQKTLGWHPAFRCFFCLCCVSWLGLALGIPFPTFLKALKKEYPGWIPLAFALNGGMSVLGSVLMVLVAMQHGITATFIGGAICYLFLPLLFPKPLK
jgi:spermidine synthase